MRWKVFPFHYIKPQYSVLYVKITVLPPITHFHHSITNFINLNILNTYLTEKHNIEKRRRRELSISEQDCRLFSGGQYRIRTRVIGLEGQHDIQTTPIAL